MLYRIPNFTSMMQKEKKQKTDCKTNSPNLIFSKSAQSISKTEGTEKETNTLKFKTFIFAIQFMIANKNVY